MRRLTFLYIRQYSYGYNLMADEILKNYGYPLDLWLPIRLYVCHSATPTFSSTGSLIIIGSVVRVLAYFSLLVCDRDKQR